MQRNGRRCESTTVVSIILDLQPGVGLGPFSLVYPHADGRLYTATRVDPVFILFPAFEEARMKKNSALAGAITGAALAMTREDHSHEQVVQYAITGAAISAAANLLTNIF